MAIWRMIADASLTAHYELSVYQDICLSKAKTMAGQHSTVVPGCRKAPGAMESDAPDLLHMPQRAWRSMTIELSLLGSFRVLEMDDC